MPGTEAKESLPTPVIRRLPARVTDDHHTRPAHVQCFQDLATDLHKQQHHSACWLCNVAGAGKEHAMYRCKSTQLVAFVLKGMSVLEKIGKSALAGLLAALAKDPQESADYLLGQNAQDNHSEATVHDPSTLTLLKYLAPAPGTGAPGHLAAAHEDKGLLTVIHADCAAGLQVGNHRRSHVNASTKHL